MGHERGRHGADRIGPTTVEHGATSDKRTPGERTPGERTPGERTPGKRTLSQEIVQCKVPAGLGPAAVDVPRATGEGRPLPVHTRVHMERLFGASFERVRVHEDGAAAAAGAVALARGDDLHFSPGTYAPDSEAGQTLLAHELTHVVQQRAGRVDAPQGKGGIVADSALEAEADQAALRVVRGESAGVAGGGDGRPDVVQCYVGPGAADGTRVIIRATGEKGEIERETKDGYMVRTPDANRAKALTYEQLDPDTPLGPIFERHPYTTEVIRRRGHNFPERNGINADVTNLAVSVDYQGLLLAKPLDYKDSRGIERTLKQLMEGLEAAHEPAATAMDQAIAATERYRTRMDELIERNAGRKSEAAEEEEEEEEDAGLAAARAEVEQRVGEVDAAYASEEIKVAKQRLQEILGALFWRNSAGKGDQAQRQALVKRRGELRAEALAHEQPPPAPRPKTKGKTKGAPTRKGKEKGDPAPSGERSNRDSASDPVAAFAKLFTQSYAKDDDEDPYETAGHSEQCFLVSAQWATLRTELLDMLAQFRVLIVEAVATALPEKVDPDFDEPAKYLLDNARVVTLSLNRSPCPMCTQFLVVELVAFWKQAAEQIGPVLGHWIAARDILRNMFRFELSYSTIYSHSLASIGVLNAALREAGWIVFEHEQHPRSESESLYTLKQARYNAAKEEIFDGRRRRTVSSHGNAAHDAPARSRKRPQEDGKDADYIGSASLQVPPSTRKLRPKKAHHGSETESDARDQGDRGPLEDSHSQGPAAD